eukprot:TRINITY_DN10702_c0_g1_i2.p1 TRINITY_DN10702_c0_g1~~TRINITY_DN10702_c0_g1_i2.p1  ORF type:complete len:899 (+),score=166.47 TRINITY_DN10702_c0_g1_i2:100-2796(+)
MRCAVLVSVMLASSVSACPIILQSGTHSSVDLAAREVRHYVHAVHPSGCTPFISQLPRDMEANDLPVNLQAMLSNESATVVIVSQSDDVALAALIAALPAPLVDVDVAGSVRRAAATARRMVVQAPTRRGAEDPGAEAHIVRSVQLPQIFSAAPRTGAHGAHVVVVAGATPRATLYAAYAFAEDALGVSFLLDRDVIPHTTPGAEGQGIPPYHISPVTGTAGRARTPQFALRGIQPFHDFTVGPDWWAAADWKTVLTQAAKQRLNFIGLHSYPLREPLVWAGDPSHVDESGNVAEAGAYPVTWRTTNDSQWGEEPRATSDYTAGSAMLFPRDCYSSPAQVGLCEAKDPKSAAAITNNAADLVGDAFRFAGALGIVRAVGTEVPFSVPKGSHVSAATAMAGAFKRLGRKIPMDIYWHWTPEGWEWGKVKVNSSATKQAVEDIKTAVRVRAEVNGTEGRFDVAFGTCGWLVGPLDDPTYFDTVLSPTDVPSLSAIDPLLGWDGPERAYADIHRHSKWVIPWMEDDPGLIGAELWVNRTLEHARTARTYGIEGLMGIHWRTLEPALTISAMAQAGWDTTVTAWEVYRKYTHSAFGAAGADVADALARLLVSVDSFAPGHGPHDIPSNETCWGNCRTVLPRVNFQCCVMWLPSPTYNPEDYHFVGQWDALRARVAAGGAAALAEFDIWAGLFHYHQAIGVAQYAMWNLTTVTNGIATLPEWEQKAAAETHGIAAVAALSRAWDPMMGHLLSFARTQGELGLVNANEGIVWMKFALPEIQKLENMTKTAIPAAAMPSRSYAGASRVFVLGERTLVQKAEGTFTVTAVALAADIDAVSAVLEWRPLTSTTQTPFRRMKMTRVAAGRGWFEAGLPTHEGDLEYRVVAAPAAYPAADRTITVVMME